MLNGPSLSSAFVLNRTEIVWSEFSFEAGCYRFCEKVAESQFNA